MSKTCRPYELHQPVLLPPDLREWLPQDHVAFFVRDGVDARALAALCTSSERGEGRGPPPYDRALRVKLREYGYCTGKPSWRQSERAP